MTWDKTEKTGKLPVNPSGGLIGLLVMGLLYFLLRNWRPMTVNRVFGKALSLKN